MKVILTKENNFYYLIQDGRIVADLDGHPLKSITGKLSKQNCDSIFGVVNVEKLAEECSIDWNGEVMEGSCGIYKEGFNKAMELNKDKVFTLEDVRKAFNKGYLMKFNPSDEYTETLTGLVQFIQQPTEIEVEVVMDICGDKVYAVPEPKIDENGCLILKRVI